MADPTDNLDDGAEIARIMRKEYIDLVRLSFLDVRDHGINVAFDLEMREVQQVLDKLAKQVRGVAETTKQEIRDLVSQQAHFGWSTEQMADAIRTLGITRSETRAIMISRTETARAYSQGSLIAFKASGVVSGVEWLVTEPCPECAALAGKIVKLGDEFAPGIDAPPAHPSCRCAISPIVE